MPKSADAAICEDALEAFCLICLKNWGVLTTDPVVWQVTMKIGYQVFVITAFYPAILSDPFYKFCRVQVRSWALSA